MVENIRPTIRCLKKLLFSLMNMYVVVHSVARQCLHCCKIDQHGDSKISEGHNCNTPEPIHKKFGVGDYVGDDSPHAKTDKKLCYCTGTARGTCQ